MLDHFNLLAPVYERLIPPPDVSRLAQLLGLPTGGRLLDAGGGTGRVCYQLRSLVGELVLTDLSYGMLQQARQKDDLRLSLAHAEKLPFADESFDRILVVDALHHFCNQAEAITDLARVLKPGGRLVIEEPDLGHFRVKMIAAAEKLALMRSRFYHPAEIGRMMAGNDLATRIERDEGLSAWVIGDK